MKGRHRRRLSGELAFFLEALCLHVKAGLDLAQAWEQSLAFAGDLPVGREAPWYWRGLSRSWPVPDHRIWFDLLEELEGSGAPLTPFLEAYASAVRQERAREVEAFCRSLPQKLGIALLLIYLPAAFLLMFGPLLLSLPFGPR